jgi:TetR/AcrR family transcriptional regulator
MSNTRSNSRSRSAAATRGAILDAAERLFAEKGFAATSIRDVAEASGASKALVHHHFGNKDDLYLAVKETVVKRYKAAQSPQLSADVDPAQFVIQGMRVLFDFYRENPTLVRLGTWTQLEGETARWPSDEELWEMILERMRNAQQQGVIRRDIHPAFLLTMAGALAYNWWQFKASRKHLLRYFPNGEKLDDLYLEHMLEVFLHGVAGPELPRDDGAGEPSGGEET